MLFYNITQIIKKLRGLPMTSTVNFLSDYSTLNEEEFIARMREKPLVDLDTSSADKVTELSQLFAALQTRDPNKKALMLILLMLAHLEYLIIMWQKIMVMVWRMQSKNSKKQ
jgi:hypothetical protein